MASSNDGQFSRSLNGCLENLLTSGINTDVTFLVGQNKTNISALKYILISRSPVFGALLEGALAETGPITIPDISSEIFTKFLRYLYTDRISLRVNTATSVLYVARKYMVDRLVGKCESFLKCYLNTQNVCQLLEDAHHFNEDGLINNCLNLIWKSEGALRTGGFLDLCGTCVKSIMESDHLAVNESRVYEAVIRWSEAECCRQGLHFNDINRRQVLGEILYTVRFPIMYPGYFRVCVALTDVLTTSEMRDINLFYVNPTQYPTIRFN
ncbi:BTB/POZ domain-containing protein 6-like [Ylistrum balloti]|uniref:BTB/POZ domain-containing protein 6-like n=1 Tax=Ylistrum balloti TaxID=509963 RepID=UPI002905F4E5|nr:BTB/POZ domain-containing protein 6-like [Ylistrum balloti]